MDQCFCAKLDGYHVKILKRSFELKEEMHIFLEEENLQEAVIL